MCAQTVGNSNRWLKVLLLTALVVLYIQLHIANNSREASHSELLLNAGDGDIDMSMRNSSFPHTFISSIHVNLTSPEHSVRLVWKGPDGSQQVSGPFHSSPGRGREGADCNDCDQSTRGGSYCTPKGTWQVEAFSDTMASAPALRFVTWFHTSREIAFHSHPEVPDHPASSGCVRLNEYAAQVIHNNSIAGKTQVTVEGTWTPPPAGEARYVNSN